MNHPYDKTWWIDGGKILGGCYPGTLDVEEQRDMLRSLLGCGITHFINLQQETDKARGQPFRDYMALARPIATGLGRELGFERFAIPDQGTPGPALMARCLDHLDAVIQTGAKPLRPLLGRMWPQWNSHRMLARTTQPNAQRGDRRDETGTGRPRLHLSGTGERGTAPVHHRLA